MNRTDFITCQIQKNPRLSKLVGMKHIAENGARKTTYYLQYIQRLRGGCWFCHNQSVNQLRLLRKNYPDLWQLMLKWDNDSPVTFHPDGHTVHDFDRRFALEDDGFIVPGETFRWKMLDEPLNMRLY